VRRGREGGGSWLIILKIRDAKGSQTRTGKKAEKGRLYKKAEDEEDSEKAGRLYKGQSGSKVRLKIKWRGLGPDNLAGKKTLMERENP